MTRPLPVSKRICRASRLIEGSLQSSLSRFPRFGRCYGSSQTKDCKCLPQERGKVRLLGVIAEPLGHDVSGCGLQEIFARADKKGGIFTAASGTSDIGL